MIKIKLANIDLKACHGVYEEERQNGNRFCVNVEFLLKNSQSLYSDNISDTLNYEDVYEIVIEEMGIPSYLLEHVAQRIFDKIKKLSKYIENLKVSVAKYNPFGDGNVDQVSVEITD